MIIEQGKWRCYMDGYLYKNLAYAKDKVLNSPNKFIQVTDGKPGTGKTTLTCQEAKFCDSDFGLDDTVFTSDDFMDVIKNSSKGQAVLLDEAFEGINRRRTQSLDTMQILSALQKVRSKKLFVFINLPFLYDLDKNIILGLTDLFIHCYKKPFGHIGQFAGYEPNRLKKLWLYCRHDYSYKRSVCFPNIRGRFTQKFPLDMDTYEEKKDKSYEKFKQTAEKKNKYCMQRDKLILKLIELNVKQKDIAAIIDLKQQAISEIVSKAGTV